MKAARQLDEKNLPPMRFTSGAAAAMFADVLHNTLFVGESWDRMDAGERAALTSGWAELIETHSPEEAASLIMEQVTSHPCLSAPLILSGESIIENRKYIALALARHARAGGKKD